MKIAVYGCLAIVFALCIGVGIFVFVLLGPREKETWSTLAALLAVIAAGIAVLPALRVLQVQEDSQRPRPMPYFDLTSRYGFLQLRLKNMGASVAYDVELHWETPLMDDQKDLAKSLNRTAVLLPQESVSTPIGGAHEMVPKFADTRFAGECSYKDASGKKYKEAFVCSVDGNQHQLLHDTELPRTLRDLQDLPGKLDAIVEQLKKLTPPPEPPSEEFIEQMKRNLGRLQQPAVSLPAADAPPEGS